MKIDAFYFQAISGVFLRLSGAQHDGEALRRVAAAGAGCCAFALFNDIFAGQAPIRRQTALAGGRRAGAAHKFLRRSCAPFATAQTAPVAPLVGPALLGRRQWCIDIHGNP